MQKAVMYLEDIGKITGKSSIFMTDPWGFREQSEFYNAIIRIKFNSVILHQLLIKLKEIEKESGREYPVSAGAQELSILTLSGVIQISH